MIKTAFEKISKSELMRNHLSKMAKDPEGYGLRFLVLANIAKDVVNCGFYVNQSLNNKDIPEEKRKFVAALDMANGMVMISLQLLLGFGFTSKKVQEKITNKLFGGLEEAATNFTKNRIAANNFPDRIRYKLMDSVKNIPAGCKTGFTAISTIVVTTILAKRVLAPFIATPLASWLKNNYMSDKKTAESKNNVQIPKTNISSIVPTNPANAPIGLQNTYTHSGMREFKTFNNFAQGGRISL